MAHHGGQPTAGYQGCGRRRIWSRSYTGPERSELPLSRQASSMITAVYPGRWSATSSTTRRHIFDNEPPHTLLNAPHPRMGHIFTNKRATTSKSMSYYPRHQSHYTPANEPQPPLKNSHHHHNLGTITLSISQPPDALQTSPSIPNQHIPGILISAALRNLLVRQLTAFRKPFEIVLGAFGKIDGDSKFFFFS